MFGNDSDRISTCIAAPVAGCYYTASASRCQGCGFGYYTSGNTCVANADTSQFANNTNVPNSGMAGRVASLVGALVLLIGCL
jgi:hypothetical protein